jgi:hypothetical protein
MVKKKASSRNLSTQTKLYWLLNSATLVNLLIIYFSNISKNAPQNNELIHFIYNITSIFSGLPSYIVFSLRYIFFKEGFDDYQQALFINSTLVAIFILGFFTNFIITKIIFSSFIQNLYLKFLKPYPFLITAILAIIIILFAIN